MRMAPALCNGGRAILSVVIALCLAGRAAGQTVEGVVRDPASGAPVQAADIALLDSTNVVISQTRTDSRGHFRFDGVRAGVYLLRASRLGYEEVRSAPFRVGSDSVFAEISMFATAIRIDSIEARARSRSQRLVDAGFYDRQAKGFGSFLTREEIDAAAPEVITDVLRSIPGVRIIRAGLGNGSFDVLMPGATSMFLRESDTPGMPSTRTCYPSVAIDGVVVRRGGREDEVGGWVHLVPPSDIDGIELYTSAAGLPVQFGGQTSPCGSILIWTRRTG